MESKLQNTAANLVLTMLVPDHPVSPLLHDQDSTDVYEPV